jgi:hypothetical protein
MSEEGKVLIAVLALFGLFIICLTLVTIFG